MADSHILASTAVDADALADFPLLTAAFVDEYRAAMRIDECLEYHGAVVPDLPSPGAG